jgi:filamentous hemagglutinin family protein
MTRRLNTVLLTTTALAALGIVSALAGPDGANVVGGAATIQGQGSASVTINQSSERAVINWRHFDIGAGESARFNQPSSSSVALNRVTGGLGPTHIEGTLSANGRVFVVNRDGILIGPRAKIDTAGFLATTNDIRDDDFMAGRYNFNIPGRSDASVVNHGTITAHSAGFAALVAPGVRNTGTITATLGTVGLASGNSFTLDFYGDRLITLAIGDSIGTQVRDVQTGQPLNSLVENVGRIQANGGRVELTAAEARRVVDSVINNRGVIEANTVGTRGGTIVLGAATRPAAGSPRQIVRVGGTLSASAPKGTKNAKIKDRDGTGGRVVVTGESIVVNNARIDVSGPAGGGTVLIGGDWGGGNPNTSAVSHAARERVDPDRRQRGGRQFNDDRRVVHRARRRRQGDRVGRRRDRVPRQHPRHGRPGRRQRRLRRSIGPSVPRLPRHGRHARAARSDRHAAAGSVGCHDKRAAIAERQLFGWRLDRKRRRLEHRYC